MNMPTDNATAARSPQALSALSIDSIRDRQEATRRISSKHALALMESIAAVGLIQPVVVDETGTLLAGGHRLQALRLLRGRQPEMFASLFPDGAVPVRTFQLGGQEAGERRAFEIELSENEKRRDYTGKELHALAVRLKQAGYRTASAGARKKDDKHKQKHVTEALALILGKSRRQVQRLLNSDGGSAAARPTQQEAAMARCLGSMKRALAASLATDGLEDAAVMLIEAIEQETKRLAKAPPAPMRRERANRTA